MLTQSTQITLRRWFTLIAIGSLAAALAWVIVGLPLKWYEQIHSIDDWRARILLTLSGLSVGAWFARLQIGASSEFRGSVLAALVATLVSQVCFFLLLWTGWKAHTWLWRVWWLSVVPAVAWTHVLVLLTATTERGLVERVSAVCAAVTAILLLRPALRADILSDPGIVYVVLLAVPGAVAVGGSLVTWRRARRDRPPVPWPRPVKWAAFLAGQVALVLIAFYAGRVTVPPASPLDVMPSALVNLSRDELDSQTRSDLERLKTIADGLDELERKAAVLQSEIRARREADNRRYYRPDEEDNIRAHFMSYLAYRAALLRMVATYAGFESVRDPELRARSFLVGYGAGTTVLRASLMLVTTYREDETVRQKLNEADVAWGLPAGMFDRIYENLSSERNVETFEEMALYFRDKRDDWRRSGVLPEADFKWLDERITHNIADVQAHSLNRYRTRLEQLVKRVKRDVYSPVYAAQSVVSTWIGDTRLVERPPFISHEQIGEMESLLQPGDILLERRNWFFSNAFLPGFWPHGALYVGRIEQLERLGIVRREGSGWTSDDPVIRERLGKYLQPAPDRNPHTVIESVSEGVIFNSLTESMHADYVAALRPRLSDAQKAQAIVRAFSHQGKPYDFEFDFFSADKLVCTELVYRSYEGLLHFDLIRIMGRDTLPALEICRKFARERTDDSRQLDFVLFLDGVPAECCARLADEEDFCASAARSRGFNE